MSLLRLNHHEQHLETTTQSLSRGSLASELDKDTIRRFFAVRMGREALTMVEEGKQVPKDLVEYF
jgi:hypothetical protein